MRKMRTNYILALTIVLCLISSIGIFVIADNSMKHHFNQVS